eukprot:SAG11_NODE_104_length_16539_cov_8.526642_12_plen_62_part_00
MALKRVVRYGLCMFTLYVELYLTIKSGSYEDTVCILRGVPVYFVLFDLISLQVPCSNSVLD